MNTESKKYLSTKDIPAAERLIFALDVPDYDSAMALVDALGDSVQFYKLGLELFVAEGYHKLFKELKRRNKRVFVDMKFFDVPRTVGAAVKEMRNLDVDFLTIHGNENILREAVKHKSETLKILAVTVLTSLDSKDVADMFPDIIGDIDEDIVETMVLSRAKRAVAAGCDGVISSGIEAHALREAYGESFIIVTPGIRPFENEEGDQKRVTNVEQAFGNGADYIVVGRAIRDHHGFATPKEAADDIQRKIAALFGA